MNLGGGAARIVLVEDDPELARSASRVLRGLGDVVVDTCFDVAAAKRAIQAPFDVLVSDFHLPDGTGVDVLTAAADANNAAPRILVTAHTEWSTASMCINVGGAFRVLAKPLAAEVLANAVGDALTTKRVRDAEAEARAVVERNALELAAANADFVLERLGNGRHAMRERERMIRALSRAIDRRVGLDIPRADAIAVVGRAFAQRLGMTTDEIATVEAAILLHRIGCIALRDDEAADLVPHIGAEILRSAGFPTAVTRSVADSCEPFDAALASRSSDEIPVAARILAIASRYLELTGGDGASHETACSRLLRDETLDPHLAAAFIMQPASMWVPAMSHTIPYAPACLERL